MSQPVRVVLSDLDDTLFDHRRATRAALLEACAGETAFARWSLDELDDHHRVVLDLLHKDVLAGKRTVDDARVERFGRLLHAASGDHPVDRATAIAAAYRASYEKVWFPVAGAMALLDALQEAGLRVVIVTNNGVAEQQLKLHRCAMTPLVHSLVTSEETGSAKPSPEIFRVALERADAHAGEAVMLGDNWVADIEGARAAGIRAVWLNRFDEVSLDPDVVELRTLEPTDAALRALRGQS